MSNIGKTIKKIRAEKGLTQEQLAEQLHVTRQAVSNWEQEKTQPDVETLTTMAEVLEVPVEEQGLMMAMNTILRVNVP